MTFGLVLCEVCQLRVQIPFSFKILLISNIGKINHYHGTK